MDYFRGTYVTLPATDSPLSTDYSDSDYVYVNASDSDRVGQESTQYAVHLFKDYIGNEPNFRIRCELRSTLAPSSSTVYLQIYNRNSSTWETLTSNNTSPADADFTLQYDIASVTNYVDTNKLISCRVYQWMET